MIATVCNNGVHRLKEQVIAHRTGLAWTVTAIAIAIVGYLMFGKIALYYSTISAFALFQLYGPVLRCGNFDSSGISLAAFAVLGPRIPFVPSIVANGYTGIQILGRTYEQYRVRLNLENLVRERTEQNELLQREIERHQQNNARLEAVFQQYAQMNPDLAALMQAIQQNNEQRDVLVAQLNGFFQTMENNPWIQEQIRIANELQERIAGLESQAAELRSVLTNLSEGIEGETARLSAATDEILQISALRRQQLMQQAV